MVLTCVNVQITCLYDVHQHWLPVHVSALHGHMAWHGHWHMAYAWHAKQILRATDDQETAVTGMNRAPGVCAAHMQI